MKTHSYIKEIKEICNHNHLTIYEIFDKIKIQYTKAGRSTIYRNVEELSRDGILKKLTGVHNKSIYELNIGNHIHLIDENTGKLIDIDLNNLQIPGIPDNFKVSNVDIKVFGNF